ncbi:muramoyltetrapeptide carboxypeptidase [Pararobbsia silviterrae]|uniref:Muramoyltetrapeptide carboxypeptidase n=1 Tax=Pararobbsia silviterrae TaxID=1792498 RepID=A0A494Y070_9BURK|nr:muramoyltetrapeptide carboxypeptidase [Pararobbsia silviterrae]RKP54699.1 muramoyltetrapeptide carboxypeptidase [Pararobbsia silviterrae]
MSLAIELIAPSGYPKDPAAVARGIARLEREGATVRGAEVATRRLERFAGTDDERLADINRLADPRRPLADIVMAVRGGYGASRLLDRIDYAGLRRRFEGTSTMIVGHSDFTAIQLALLAKSGLVTFGGPMLCGNFGVADASYSAFMHAHFWNAVRGPVINVESTRPQVHTLNVRGTLWGGNLAMIASLVGTPYLPRIDGGILFLEDIGERPYRIERMLYQLHQAGILARQQAIVLGDFSQSDPVPYDNGYDVADAVAQIRAQTGVPILTGLQFGHCDDIVTLPVGASARLMSDPDGFVLEVSGYPCVGRARAA